MTTPAPISRIFHAGKQFFVDPAAAAVFGQSVGVNRFATLSPRLRARRPPLHQRGGLLYARVFPVSGRAIYAEHSAR